MDELISRKAALELLGEPHPLDYNAIADVQKIIALPSVPAVPLDKLCEWLANNAYMYLTEAEMDAGYSSHDPAYWEIKLTLWMEKALKKKRLLRSSPPRPHASGCRKRYTASQASFVEKLTV